MPSSWDGGLLGVVADELLARRRAAEQRQAADAAKTAADRRKADLDAVNAETEQTRAEIEATKRALAAAEREAQRERLDRAMQGIRDDRARRGKKPLDGPALRSRAADELQRLDAAQARLGGRT
jgi:hypothetical protein